MGEEVELLIKEILTKNFGKKIKNPDEVKKIFYDSGAIEYGEKLIKKYLNNSIKIAAKYGHFLDLINLMENRKK